MKIWQRGFHSHEVVVHNVSGTNTNCESVTETLRSPFAVTLLRLWLQGQSSLVLDIQRCFYHDSSYKPDTLTVSDGKQMLQNTPIGDSCASHHLNGNILQHALLFHAKLHEKLRQIWGSEIKPQVSAQVNPTQRKSSPHNAEKVTFRRCNGHSSLNAIIFYNRTSGFNLTRISRDIMWAYFIHITTIFPAGVGSGSDYYFHPKSPGWWWCSVLHASGKFSLNKDIKSTLDHNCWMQPVATSINMVLYWSNNLVRVKFLI